MRPRNSGAAPKCCKVENATSNSSIRRQQFQNAAGAHRGHARGALCGNAGPMAKAPSVVTTGGPMGEWLFSERAELLSLPACDRNHLMWRVIDLERRVLDGEALMQHSFERAPDCVAFCGRRDEYVCSQ